MSIDLRGPSLVLLALASCQPAPPEPAPSPRVEDASGELTPEAYVHLHDAARDPADPGWSDAMTRLEGRGDRFTLSLLDELEDAELAPDARATLERTRAAIAGRAPEESAASVLATLRPRLERAAWADVQCDPLEDRLAAWTLASVLAQADDPAVRAALETLRTDYEPSVEVRTVFSSLSSRVRDYAERLLRGESGGATR